MLLCSGENLRKQTRSSGKKKEIENDVKIAAFFGDSFTYGMGLDYNKTFVGLIENEKKDQTKN